MLRDDDRQWIERHGGIARTEGPDANGVTTYYAADGNYISVLQDGTPRMRGFKQADAAQVGSPASAPESAPPASAPSGGAMDQQGVEKWITENGGAGRVQYSRSTREVMNPAADVMTAQQAGVAFDPTAPAKLIVNEEKWTAVDDKGKPTGAVLHVRRKPDNSFDVVDQANANPITPAATTGQKPTGSTTNIEGTPTGRKDANGNDVFDNERPVMVTRGPDGKLISSEPLTPSEMEEWRRNRERSRNPGGKSDAEIQAEKDRNKPGAPVLKPDGKGGTIAVQAMPDGTIKTTPLPGVPSDARTVTIEGIVYEKGADGQYAPVVRGPSQTPGAGGGPRLPKFVFGQIAATLTQYQEDLNNDPSLTPTQRKERLDEALQVSTHVMNEATILQREQESNLNASVNLATNRVKAGQDALTSATNIVNSINDKLPVGSSQGGKAFAAMMGLNLLNQQRSGLNDIVPGRSAQGQQYDAAARPVIAATQANLSRLTAPPAPSTVPPPPAPTAPTPPPAAPPMAAASPIPGPVPAPLPGAGASVARPSPADGNERPDDILTVVGQQGVAQEMSRAEYDALPPAVRGSTRVTNARPSQAVPAMAPAPQIPVPVPSANEWAPGASVRPGGAGEPAPAPIGSENGGDMGPYPVPLPISAPGNNVQMAPPPTFAALAAYQPAPMAAPAPTPTMAASPPALLHAKAASRPPWRFSDAEIREMEQAGVPMDIIQSVPGARVA